MASTLLLFSMGVIVLAFLSVSLDASNRTNRERDDYNLETVAEAATTLAADRLWAPYAAQQEVERSSLGLFRLYLDSLGVLDQSGVEDPVPLEVLSYLGIPEDGTGATGLSGADVNSVKLHRIDDADATRLFFATTVTSRKGRGGLNREPLTRTVRQTFRVGTEDWNGLDYALLANNINCIMCHADIDSATRYFNRDAGAYDSFDRVKVGSLESLQIRHQTFSSIAGTLYVRGNAYDAAGDPIHDWAFRDLLSRDFNSAGKLLQDAWGNTIPVPLDPASELNPQPYENLYLGYGIDPESQVDGYLPTSFPAVFPDDGGIDPNTGDPDSTGAGNRTIDDNEFFAAVAGINGSISGGLIHIADPNNVIDTAADLNAVTTGNTGTLDAITEGNVFLYGTPENPIVLNGDLAVRGDVVLFGHVKGEGSLMVSGNVYIPSDLNYADGTDGDGLRTYGLASDGTRNALAIASGGNIMVGNIFHGRWGVGEATGDQNGSFSFIMDELAIFNRQEWTKTQPMLPGELDDPLDPTTWTVENPLYQGPEYLPRYYAFKEDGPVPIFNRGSWFDSVTETWRGPELPGTWGEARLTIADPTNPSDPDLFNPDGTAKAVVYNLTGTRGWISDEMLKKLMSEWPGSRVQDVPLGIDSMLYSNNSIFGIVPTRERNSNFSGRLQVNGGIIAADLGLLSPRALQVNYDERIRGLLRITSDSKLSFRRMLWAPHVDP